MLSIGSLPIRVVDGDIPQSCFNEVMSKGLIACDIETTGLEWKHESIASVQILVPDSHVVVVRPTVHLPRRIGGILEAPNVQKIFHHAMFDLRFIAHHWHVMAANVKCTKIASKLLKHDNSGHSLKDLLNEHLQVEIDKTCQRSDWLRGQLTDQQLLYAAADVVYLPRLFDVLSELLDRKSLMGIAERCFHHIPTQVWLETHGVTDVFEY